MAQDSARAGTSCSCWECQLPCLSMPGALSAGDLTRLSELRGPWQTEESWYQEHLRASTGSTLMSSRTGQVIRIPSLVPAQRPNRQCHWFDCGKCAVHAISPWGCRGFDAHQSDDEATRLQRESITERASLFSRETKYSRTWEMLWGLGLRVDSESNARALRVVRSEMIYEVVSGGRRKKKKAARRKILG